MYSSWSSLYRLRMSMLLLGKIVLIYSWCGMELKLAAIFYTPIVLGHDLASQNPYWFFLCLLCVSATLATQDISHWKSISGSVSDRVSDFEMCRSKQEKVTLLICHALLAKPLFPLGYSWATQGRMAVSDAVLWRGHVTPVRSSSQKLNR